MSAPWAARVPLDAALAVGALRTREGLRALVAKDALWLSGPDLDEETDLGLRRIRGCRRFRVSTGGALVAVGRELPEARLPEGEWSPLAEVLEVAAPPAALPGLLPVDAERPVLELAPTTEAQEPNAIVTRLDDWVAWASSAADARLQSLAFAASADGRALVLRRGGGLLPPIRGSRHVETDGLVVPLGLEIRPRLDAAELRAALGLLGGELAILRADGSHERVPGDALVAARRSAARHSDEELARGS